jgi:hypothetical protein
MSDVSRLGDAEEDDMDPSHRLNDMDAERLLDSAAAARGAHASTAEPLELLLAAAAGPASEQELSGQAAALAAFRAAGPADAPRRLAKVRRLLAIKIGALTAGLAIGGVALAAGTGIVPTPFSGPPAPAGPSESATSADPSVSVQASTGGSASPSVEPTPSAAANLLGHCRAYLAKPLAERGRSLETREFADLVTTAGGADRVDAFCAGVVQAAEAGKPSKSAHPTGPPSPSGQPDAAAVTPPVSTAPSPPGTPSRRLKDTQVSPAAS